jgi:DNA-binding transcriptional regulator YiaG
MRYVFRLMPHCRNLQDSRQTGYVPVLSLFPLSKMALKTQQAAFVSNIAAHRKRVGMTQRELALALDLTEASVQNWESGRVSGLHIYRIVRLCELLDCRVQDLLEPITVDDLPIEAESATTVATPAEIIEYIPRIQELRKRRKLKQRQIALELQVTERTVKGWEKGDVGMDVIIRLIQLCNLFECKVGDLIMPNSSA